MNLTTMNNKRLKSWLIALPTLILLILVGCSSSNSPRETSLTLNFKRAAVSGLPVYKSAAAGAIDQITLNSASIVISKIEFKSIGEDSLDFLNNEPIVVELDLSGALQRIGSVPISPGAYNETEFKINQLSESDSALYDTYPDMQDISIRVTGYIDGNPDSSFVWISDLDEEQVFEFEQVSILDGEDVELTFVFDTSQWFVDEQSMLLDPRDQQNYSAIENNIKHAFDIEQEDTGIL